MDFFLLVLCLLFAIALLRKTRALGVRAEEDSIRHSVKTVAEQWVSVDIPSEEDTTPPDAIDKCECGGKIITACVYECHCEDCCDCRLDYEISYEEDETQEVDCEAVRQAEAFLMSLTDLEDMGE
jgi:hypothetical protein